MKKWIFVFCLFILAGIAQSAIAQKSRFRSTQLKYVDVGRHKALTTTIIPIVTGIGSAHFIHSKTVQVTGSLLAVYGLIMGPSAGNFYAVDYLRGLIGVAARFGGGYLMKDATREIMGDHVADAMGWDKKDVSLTNTKVLIGAGLILGSAIYNIISVKASVHQFNKKQGYYVRPNTQVRNGRFVPMISAGVQF